MPAVRSRYFGCRPYEVLPAARCGNKTLAVQIQAQPADPSPRVLFQEIWGRPIEIDGHHTAALFSELLETLEQAGVIGSVKTRLHNHKARHAERFGHGE